MTWVYGIDCSDELITYPEALALKDAGVAVLAQCLWTGNRQPEHRVTNLRNCRDAGLALVGYISIAPGHEGDWHVDQACGGVPADLWDALKKVPIDVELEGLAFHHVLMALAQTTALGKQQDVYTNYNTWVNVLGNPNRPDGCGLWNAYWDGDADFDYPHLRFGNWLAEEAWGEQWSGGTLVEGQLADRNQFNAEQLGIGIPRTTPGPTPPNQPAPNPRIISQLLHQVADELAR